MRWKNLKKLKEFRQYFGVILIGLLLFLILKTGILNPVVGVLQVFSVPIQTSFEQSTKGITNILKTVSEIGSLRGQDSDLRRENALLKSENVILKELEKENVSLREQLGTSESKLKIIVAAHPIGNGAVGVKNVLLIDKGTNDKVKIHDIVIVGKIMIGQIISVSPKVSSVQLLTDPDTKIPAVTIGGAEGIIQGEFGAGTKLTDVVQEKILNIGELVITSGRNNLPRGLVLGKIAKINKVEKEFFQTGEVVQTINLNDVSLVYIAEN